VAVGFRAEQFLFECDQPLGIAEHLLLRPTHLLAQCLQAGELAPAELVDGILIRRNVIFAFLFLGTLLGLKLRLQLGALRCCHFCNIHVFWFILHKGKHPRPYSAKISPDHFGE